LDGVILAAGEGTRSNPLNRIFPKALLPVGNKPLIFHQLEEMHNLGIKRVFIVISPSGSQILKTVTEYQHWGLDINFVHQQVPLGIAHAVLTVEPYVKNPFIVFLGDIYGKYTALATAVNKVFLSEIDGILLAKEEPDFDSIRQNYAIIVDGSGKVTKVAEKPTTPVSNLKGCGVYVFKPAFFNALQRTPKSSMRNEYEITDAIQIYIDMGYKLRAAKAVEWDINLNSPRDLIYCNLAYLDQQGLEHIIAPDAKLSAGTRVSRSVIGRGVCIEHPIAIDKSVILPGTRVVDRTNISSKILGPDIELDFSSDSRLGIWR